MRATLFVVVLAVVVLSGCRKSTTEPKVDLYGRMYGTWIGVLRDFRPSNPVLCHADSVRVVIEPGPSGPTVKMWQLKLKDDGAGTYLGVADGAAWRAVEFSDAEFVGTTEEGGNIYSHTVPDPIGGTVPGRGVGNYIFWIGPGGGPHGPGATVSWDVAEYRFGDMTLTLP